MALIHHKFNDPDAPIPLLVDADEELWTECVGDCLANWMQNSQDFFGKQQVKMKNVALEPFMFAVKAFLSQAWIDVLVQGGVLSTDRISSLDALTEDEHYMLGLAEQMFDRCAVLVATTSLMRPHWLVNLGGRIGEVLLCISMASNSNRSNKNDIKTILNFIHDVEERPKSVEGTLDIVYAEREVGELQIFKSLWAPIRRMYDKKKSQAKVCVIYFFKIMHSQIVTYGREGIDRIDFCKDRFLRKQASLEGTFESFNRSGGEAYKLGNNVKAMACYTQAAWRNPFNQACFGNRAQTYLNQREYWNALWDCKRALIRDPKNSKNWYRQARACIELDWLDEATAMNEKALKSCVLEPQRVEIVKQKRIIEGHMKKRRESESESATVTENTKTQPVYNCQDSINLLSILGDACSLYDKGNYRSSTELWAKALGIFHDLGMKRLQLSEEDLTMLKFVHAFSLIKTGIFNNLMSALDKLSALESQLCKLVSVIYGFALVYFKLNRFKEAFEQADRGLKALGRKKSRSAHDCSWLAGCEISSELALEEVKKNLQHIMEESAHPPKPDALCRFHQDNQNPRLEIYHSDPDFKGLVQVKCTLGCILEFHPSCWKTIKATQHENRNDKLMLETQCLTPDCGGLIHYILIVKSDSTTPIEIVSNIKDRATPKIQRKIVKMKTENPLKIQKKMEKKLTRKQKKMEARNDLEEETKLDDKDSAPPPNVKDKEPTVYKGKATILVKDDFDEILKSQGKNKSKNKKKKEKEVPSKQTVLPLDVKFKDEGRQLIGAEDFIMDDSTLNGLGLLPMPGTAPLPLGNGLLTVPTSIPYPPDDLANTLFELFEDILRVHGPQFLGSPFLQDIMKDFPDEAHQKIHSYGSLYNFIYSNKKFDVIAGRIVCIREDTQKAHMMADALYDMNRNIPVNGGFPAWPLSMLPAAGQPNMPPRQLPPKPAFSWEQRAREMAAKLANSSSSTNASPTASTAASASEVPTIRSSIIAPGELPSLREASSLTASKKSRKKSTSSEKSVDCITTATVPAANKNSKDDDGFTLIGRGGSKKTNSVSSASDPVNIKDDAPPIPGVISASKMNALDDFSLSDKKEVAQNVGKGKSLSPVIMVERESDTSESSKNKSKMKAGNAGGPDTSSSLNSGGLPLINHSQKSSWAKSSSFTSSVLDRIKNDDMNGSKMREKFKSKSLESGVSDGSTRSINNADTDEDVSRLKGEGDGDYHNNDDDDDDDAKSVMDSVDDPDEDHSMEDLSRQQLRQRFSGVGVVVEMLKHQQMSSIKTSQSSKTDKSDHQDAPEFLSNLSSLLSGGSVGNKQQLQQRRDSETSSPLSLSQDVSQAALRCDSPALSQGSSESSNQSQPAPLKPLKGMVGGMGILSRNKKGKQRLPAATKLTPFNLLENQDDEKSSSSTCSSKDTYQTSDLETDLNNFIYQAPQPPPSTKPEIVAQKDTIVGSVSSSDSSSTNFGIDSSFKMPILHRGDVESSNIKASSFLNNIDEDEKILKETEIDPVVLQIFGQFNTKDNSSSSISSSFISSSPLINSSMNETLESPVDNYDRNVGFASSELSQDAIKNRGVSETGSGNETQSMAGVGMVEDGRKISNMSHGQKGFVTNGAGNVVSSPPTDFLNNEDAIKKLWSCASEGDNSNQGRTMSHGFGTDFMKDSSKTYDGKNLVSSQNLSSSISSTFSGVSSVFPMSFAVPPPPTPITSSSTAVFPSLHAQSSSVPRLIENNIIIPSALDNDNRDKLVQHQRSLIPMSSSSSDKLALLSQPPPLLPSQFGSFSPSVPTTTSPSLWQSTGQVMPPPSAPWSYDTTTPYHHHLQTSSSSSSSSTYLPPTLTQNNQDPLPPLPNNSARFPSNATTYTTPNPGMLNPGVQPYNPKLNTNSPGFLSPPSTANIPTIPINSPAPFSSLPNAANNTNFNPSIPPFNPSHSVFENTNLTQGPAFNTAAENKILKNPEALSSDFTPFNRFSSNLINGQQHFDNNLLPKNELCENPTTLAREMRPSSSTSSSSSSSVQSPSPSSLFSQLNPNSREFRPTSYTTYQGSVVTDPFATATSVSSDPPVAVVIAETSCQTDKVEVSSVMTNTLLTSEKFEELLEFIKQEARRSQELKDELDRDKALLKQSQAAECVLTRSLEESKEFLDTEKEKNKEMQEKLNRLREEVQRLEEQTDDLMDRNTRMTADVNMMEQERSRAVTAELKILQISSQLMGQKLEGKKTEATKHMAQLQNACGSFTAKGIQVPPAIIGKQKEWQEFVAKCDQQYEALQNFFHQQMAQLNKGRLLKDLPDVSTLITVPEMPKPPSFMDIGLLEGERSTVDRAHEHPGPMSGNMLGANGDKAMNSMNAPPGLKPLSNTLPAPLQPKLLMQQGGIGAPANKFLQKLSQQLPQPTMPLQASSPAVAASLFQQQTPFDKILIELQKSFPVLKREVITAFLEVVRRNNGGSLSNMTVSQVVGSVRELVLNTPLSQPHNNLTHQPTSFRMEDLPVITRGGGDKEKVEDEEDYDFCPICHEDMEPSTCRTLDCNHIFHEECIRRWFQQQRSCPNCRVFSLLSDEFPSLK